MKKDNTGSVIEFYKVLNIFQHVVRVPHVPGENRRENDVEHSYFLAMMAWYMIDILKLNLDMSRVLRYALIHDLVEVYAGDTYVFSKNKELLETKHKREGEAQKRLKSEFPEIESMHECIEQYERRSDSESVFIHALDKLMPVLNQYIQDGRTWKSEKISFSDIVTLKRRTVAASPEIKNLLEQLIQLIEKDRKRFFGELID